MAALAFRRDDGAAATPAGRCRPWRPATASAIAIRCTGRPESAPDPSPAANTGEGSAPWGGRGVAPGVATTGVATGVAFDCDAVSGPFDGSGEVIVGLIITGKGSVQPV